jgi:hypothetical protein
MGSLRDAWSGYAGRLASEAPQTRVLNQGPCAPVRIPGQARGAGQPSRITQEPYQRIADLGHPSRVASVPWGRRGETWGSLSGAGERDRRGVVEITQSQAPPRCPTAASAAPQCDGAGSGRPCRGGSALTIRRPSHRRSPARCGRRRMWSVHESCPRMWTSYGSWPNGMKIAIISCIKGVWGACVSRWNLLPLGSAPWFTLRCSTLTLSDSRRLGHHEKRVTYW